MLARLVTFVILLFAVSGVSVEGGQDVGYAKLLCAVLESSNSGDPEIRENAVVEGLAYLDGEAADVLRVLLLAKEDAPEVQEALVNQLCLSDRRRDAAECLDWLAHDQQLPEGENSLQAYAKILRETTPSHIDRSGLGIHEQPTGYSGPLSTVQFATLYDRAQRSNLYEDLQRRGSRSSVEILRLFRAVEMDPALAARLRRLDREGEVSRGTEDW